MIIYQFCVLKIHLVWQNFITYLLLLQKHRSLRYQFEKRCLLKIFLPGGCRRVGVESINDTYDKRTVWHVALKSTGLENITHIEGFDLMNEFISGKNSCCLNFK